MSILAVNQKIIHHKVFLSGKNIYPDLFIVCHICITVGCLDYEIPNEIYLVIWLLTFKIVSVISALYLRWPP